MNRAALAAVAVVVGMGVLVAGLLDQIGPERSDPAKLTAKSLRAGGSPHLGSPAAPVTIVEYGDYQCTFCYRFHQTTLKTLESEYIDTGRASLIFKDFALNGPGSVLAAQASHCAGDQGMYWRYHDELYDNWGGEMTGWVTRDALGGFAEAVGLDPGEFDGCMDDQKYRRLVLDAYEEGQRIGIDATPSFLVFNDETVVKIRGNQPLDVFVKTIEGMK